MIKISYVFLIFVLLSAELAWSKEAINSEKVSQLNKNPENSQTIINFDTSSLEKTIKESIREASEKPESKDKLESERKIISYSYWLLVATFALAFITLWQAFLTRRSVKQSQDFFCFRTKTLGSR